MFGFGSFKKTVVLIIPPKQYDEEELHILDKIFKHNHFKRITASTWTIGTITSIHNETLKPDMKLSEVKLNEVDGLVLVGGIGAREFWNDSSIHRVLKQAHDMGKVLGAIGHAPITIAHAELLHGKKATVLETEAHKLETAGAIYTGADVEIDGNIITAKDRAHAKEFAEAMVEMLLRTPAAVG